MSEFAKLATSAQDQFLASLEESQENFLKAMQPYSEWVSSLPTMPVAPLAADAPTLLEITEANFAFANKFLKQQKKFAEKIFAAQAAAS